MTQLTPIKGFVNTPVSKSICIAVTLLSLALSIFDLKPYVRLAIDPFIIEYSQYWRIITYQFSVVNESDFLLVMFLWFYFKNLERFYGPRKYLSTIVAFALYNSLVCFIFMTFGQLMVYFSTYLIKSVLFRSVVPDFSYLTIFNEVIPGPVGILSSLYVCYGTYIPTSYLFAILLRKPTAEEAGQPRVWQDTLRSSELKLTNHFPIHIYYTLLLLNNGFKSVIPALLGLFIGKLHTYELLPGSKAWLIPNWVFQVFIAPLKASKKAIGAVGSRFGNQYRPVADDVPVTGAEPQENGEEDDELLDESTAQARQIRAETPVRPLGRQFLDTFRRT
ncbi:uncharacterized protein CANTADRAFT_8214 [Suhomyces tanzawaensis NRRL Y-17324]|uniref:Uncharacterized protein n=1 Tax=Suhomyces tanzawaensis NRRL Y-17324 TaxID=984487 RepID=A0A1E4SC32_9ASCO|nr:uncharacterized protein CANTADRAFT_8214 [Suhomyces tanzawaensis NRRL Y-17324]ODV77055.1 hypothetical protein CANTADRAFT_8214 [Suhomyces tanzawaensis NRRL Y-17324]